MNEAKAIIRGVLRNFYALTLFLRLPHGATVPRLDATNTIRAFIFHRHHFAAHVETHGAAHAVVADIELPYTLVVNVLYSIHVANLDRLTLVLATLLRYPNLNDVSGRIMLVFNLATWAETHESTISQTVILVLVYYAIGVTNHGHAPQIVAPKLNCTLAATKC